MEGKPEFSKESAVLGEHFGKPLKKAGENAEVRLPLADKDETPGEAHLPEEVENAEVQRPLADEDETPRVAQSPVEVRIPASAS